MMRAAVLPVVAFFLVVTGAWAGRSQQDQKRRYQPQAAADVIEALRLRSKVQRPSRSQRVRRPYRARILTAAKILVAPKAGAATVYNLRKGRRVSVLAAAGGWLYVRWMFARGWIPKSAAEKYRATFRALFQRRPAKGAAKPK